MTSDVIKIDNQGNGFGDAIKQTEKVAAYHALSEEESLKLQLLAEEMLSLARSVTGEMQASFWIEGSVGQYDLHMTTKTVMDKDKRHHLISSTTSRKNEAAKTFLGFLRNAFEEAMCSDADHVYEELPSELMNDFAGQPVKDDEWDGYERSVLRRTADNVKIAIRGGVVDMTVSKHFPR